MIKCEICSKECKNYIGIGAHVSQIHKISSKDYYDKYLKKDNESICPVCNKETKFGNVSIGYNKYCSNKCSANSLEVRNNYKKTCLKNHGVDNPNKSLEIREKSKRTCLKNYKVEYPSQSPEIREKSKQTLLKNYKVEYPAQSKVIQDRIKETNLKNHGVEYNLQSEEFKKKFKQTCKERYGHDNPFKVEEFKEKSKQTMLKKYGVEYSAQSKEIYEKQKKTMMKKYGIENPFQSLEIKEKIKKTNLKKFGVEYGVQSSEIKEKIQEKFHLRMIDRLLNSDRLKNMVEPDFDVNDYKLSVTYYSWRCIQCNNIFESDLKNGKIPRCLKCYPLDGGSSKQEKELSNFCKQYYPDLEENNRTILSGKELDIYIPELNLAIEFDGLYWHSEFKGINKEYHLNKTNKCKEQNIQLIHIFEDEWFNKQDIVKSMLLNRLGKTENKIHTRKCEVKISSSLDSESFLEENHIQGNINSKINLGLYHNSELVSILTLGSPRYNKKYEYEIHRFCNKLNHNIPGSFSKLLKYFINTYNPKSIITYSDKRFGEGKVYEKNNFTFSNTSDPNYYYMKNYSFRQPRIKYQKHKLSQLLETFDPSLTEWENMQLNHFDRIWDCGNNVWKWDKI